MFELNGKNILVTGSSRGIGRAIAAACAAAGGRVIYHGTAVTPALTEAAGNNGFVTGNLSCPSEVAALIEKVKTVVPVLDVLVLNASVQSYTGVENFAEAEFCRQMQTNVATNFELIRAFAPQMAAQGWGRVIAISSINQVRPSMRLGVYAATKAALGNLMHSCAKEYAASGVTFNTVLPGVITTDRNREGLSNEEFAEKLRQTIPAHRFGTPEDCSGIVQFLASEAASYITGADIPVAGGWQL